MVLLVFNITAVMSDVKGRSTYSPSALFCRNNSSAYCLEKQIYTEYERLRALPLLNTHLFILPNTDVHVTIQEQNNQGISDHNLSCNLLKLPVLFICSEINIDICHGKFTLSSIFMLNASI